MSPEAWIGVLAIVVPLVFGVVGYLGVSNINRLRRDAEDARDKAGNIQISFLEYQVHVSNTYVQKGDLTATLAEIFNKLKTIDENTGKRFTALEQKIDDNMRETRMELSNKMDRRDRRHTDN